MSVCVLVHKALPVINVSFLIRTFYSIFHLMILTFWLNLSFGLANLRLARMKLKIFNNLCKCLLHVFLRKLHKPIISVSIVSWVWCLCHSTCILLGVVINSVVVFVLHGANHFDRAQIKTKYPWMLFSLNSRFRWHGWNCQQIRRMQELFTSLVVSEGLVSMLSRLALST